jgi:arylsulfatase A-like enzyme
MANILRDAGWSTFWVGKNHNVPIDEWTAGASKKNWPLGQGYDRFYGFIGGETNNWCPSLAAKRENIAFSASLSSAHGRTRSVGVNVPSAIGFIGVSSGPSGRIPRSIIRGSTHSR